MSRAQEVRAAKAAGLTRFISAYPCKKCGGVLFYACAACYECQRARQSDSIEGRLNACKRSQSSYANGDNRIKKNNKNLAWAKNNPGLHAAKGAKRRASRLQRTPAWADLKAIKDFYKNCPAGYDVDHIVPLQGKLVSGLHVLENLQYLPASINRAKSNKFEV